MLTMGQSIVALYIDRTHLQWIVRDSEGSFCVVAAIEGGWEQRQPFQLKEDADLESVPTHYKYLLSLPFSS